MYSLQSVTHLDEWAKKSNLTIDTDTELSFRRLSLLVDKLTVPKTTVKQSPGENKCDVCDKHIF